VFVEKGRSINVLLENAGMPYEHRVGKGALRVYLPGYQPSDAPRVHPVLSLEKINEFIRWNGEEDLINHLTGKSLSGILCKRPKLKNNLINKHIWNSVVKYYF